MTLSPSWTSSSLGATGEWVGGGTPSKRNPVFWDGDIPWVSPKDMKTFRIRVAQDCITPEAVKSSATRMIPTRSVLMVVRSGILQRTFPVAVSETAVTINQDMKAIVPGPGIDAEFLAYYLVCSGQQILRECSKAGTTVSSIESSQIQSFGFRYPPFPEQRQIVEAIDTHFSLLDDSVRSLTQAKRNVDRARASILKAAVEGRLVPTEAALARKEGREYEHGSDLLERILAERKARHEEEQKDAKRTKTYRVPVAPDTGDLPELPEGWVWATVSQVNEILDGQRVPVKASERDSRVEGVPQDRWVPYFGAAGQAGWIDDYLFDEPLVLLGEDAVPFHDPLKPKAYRIQGRSWVNNHAHVLRPLLIRHRYLVAALNMFEYRYLITGTTRAKLTQGAMVSMALPLPPLAEQHRIVDEIDRRFSILDAVEASIDASLKRCERLRQAILKSAFEGKLIKPDVSPEPIHAEVGA